MRHSKTEDIFIVILFSAHYPFIGQLCIAIPTNRSTPYRILVADSTIYRIESVEYR
jgi:hypothetical protein